MKVRTLAGHVRRYPRWYGAAAIWLTAMALLPVVEVDPLAPFTPSRVQPVVTTEEETAASVPLSPAIGGPAAPTAIEVAAEEEIVEDTTSTTVEELTPTTEPEELELVPAELLDAIFDLIPPPVLPPLPEEISALLGVISPIAATGCSGLGLASVLVAVVAQTAEGVPIGRILPYLAPVSTACASFPIPKVHTVCEADKPLILDLAGLATTPPLLGLGIDQLDAIETQIATSFGQSFPRLAPTLREQLDCVLVS